MCCNSDKKDYAEVMKEWKGKKIVFPNTLQLVSGEQFSPPCSEYIIVAYFDSQGCMACRMQLPYWKDFMAIVESFQSGPKVDLMIITEQQDAKNLAKLIERCDFPYDIIIDKEENFTKKNTLPSNPDFQVFLLDKNYKVSALGNPALSTKVRNVYFNLLSVNDHEEEIDKENEVFEYDFGNIEPNRTVSHTFDLYNRTGDTIKVKQLVTSCECTEGYLSACVIPPDTSYSLTATFKDTVPGEFLRSLTIYFDNNDKDIRFELSGFIN